ncbi:MAG TPA: hypothetical protein VHS28_00425, partial [Chloroflexota bacterium]|nr:hypothetical protein [Chloroflexota bacterium]
MREPDNRRLRRSRQNRGFGHFWMNRPISLLQSNTGKLLIAALAVTFIAVALWTRGPSTSADQRSIASLANTGGNVATKAAHGPGSTAVPPTPTPTPSTIRPFAVATAQPVGKGPTHPSRKQGTPDPSPTTDHVIVVDGNSGEILFQRNAFEPIAPASLTKIMTAILGIEHGPLSNFVPIDVNAR